MYPLSYEFTDDEILVDSQRSERTTIGIGEDAFSTMRRYFFEGPGQESDSAVIVSDRNVWELHGKFVLAEVQKCRKDISLILVESGEQSKSIESLADVWDQLSRSGAKRRTTLIAFGGGVVCDMGGFAAATYMRGLPYIDIPTTLISQIDAAIGGKVAVDTRAAKNALGAFYHPKAVIIYPSFLSTLSDREFASGMAEVIKVALLSSLQDFEEVERLSFDFERGTFTANAEMLRRWISAKLTLLGPDPFEVGSLDRALNFGHSFGHAIETATNYGKYRHGEAVSIGMAMAARIRSRPFHWLRREHDSMMIPYLHSPLSARSHDVVKISIDPFQQITLVPNEVITFWDTKFVEKSLT